MGAKIVRLVFMGQRHQYEDYVRLHRLRQDQVLWAGSVDAARGMDLSKAELVISDGFVRDSPRILEHLRSRGLKP